MAALPTIGDEVVANARKDVGVVREIPDGSNMDLGGPLTALQNAHGVPGKAWCGSWCRAKYWAVQFMPGYDAADPSTWAIADRARRNGQIKAKPVRGCMAVRNPGARGHVCIYAGPGPRPGTFHAIGGNESNAVRETAARPSWGFLWVVPPGLEKSRYRMVRWYRWEDPQARQWVHWEYGKDAQAKRDRWMAAFAAQRPSTAGHLRKLKRTTKRGTEYGVQVGPDRYGEWTQNKAKRDREMRAVELARPGRKLRRISQTRIVRD